MSKMLLIDGNSILNRAFYGIMGSKMLMAKDGTYTNAVYGFLAIMFKVQEELNPEYMVVTFDLKGPTKRHEMYKEYKGTRKGMPDELAAQMPIIKKILKEMNICIIEKEGFEADDILGTLSVFGEEKDLDVIVLSGDRDTFQLATDKVTIRIPRTKMGKTEVEDFDKNKIEETYEVNPKQLIEVKGLQGDSSDNIPGVPGVGEKTAFKLIKEYGSIENLYNKLENDETDLKGKLKENVEENKELAILSKELGTIDLNVPIENSLEEFKVEEWNQKEIFKIFKELNFNRYIDRFNLIQYSDPEDLEKNSENNLVGKSIKDILNIEEVLNIKDILTIIQKQKKLFYYFNVEKYDNTEYIIQKQIRSISIYNKEENIIYYIKDFNIEADENCEDVKTLKEIFEDEQIEKYGYKLTEDYILLKQLNINPTNFVYDAEVASYDINPTKTKYKIEELINEYLEIDINELLQEIGEEKEEESQINIFDLDNGNNDGKKEEYSKYKNSMYVYAISKVYDITIEKLESVGGINLFNTIEMPMVEVLSEMQYNGIYVDKEELEVFGDELKSNIDEITKQIYELSEEEFNVNSPKQLGEILFEKLNLTAQKKTKNGYSTDVDVLEKIKAEHPIVEKILEYRTLAKLNSTYVEGLIPYINSKTKRIHSYFHQTITATGRISSTEPNLQNIPTRIEIGKKLRKVFKPKEGYVFVDADYSQIELRILAHISEDKNMIEAFENDEDIHKQAASKVLNIPIEEITSKERSKAKAVNFGIVYGISDFGLAGQIGVSRKEAKEYIEQYLEKYSGIKKFMEEIVEDAKEKGYVETLFNRRRYIPELKSTNYMVRQFGARASMNTPIQGTAADVMKIAMINVYKEMKDKKLKSKIVLQVHDELLIETLEEEKEDVKNILKKCMENAITLKVPLKIDMQTANNWYEAK